MIEDALNELRTKIGPSDKVICALSGGIDSATTAELLRRVIGNRLYCVFVYHGLLRKGEREKIKTIFGNELGSNLIILDDSRIFLSKLKGIKDPEKKTDRRQAVHQIFHEGKRKDRRHKMAGAGNTLYRHHRKRKGIVKA